MSPYIKKLKYHSRPHAFRFKKDKTGKVVMHYKQLANSDQAWKGKRESTVGYTVLLRTPPGRPATSRPDNEKIPSVDVMR